MSVIKHFNAYLFVFFIIGVAPLYSEIVNENHKKMKNKTYLIPVTISSILIVCIAGFLVYCNYLAELGQINTIINCCSVLSGMTFCLSAIFQCCYFPTLYQSLIFQINKIESSLVKRFSENLPLLPFAKRYKQKVMLLFFFLSVSIISATIALWKLFKMEGVFFAILQSFMSGFSGLVVSNSVLYIDMVEMFFRVLNLQIQNSSVTCKKMKFLKYVKLMHMDLWKVVIQINDFFSWSFLFFTLNYMIYVVYDLYFVFHMLQTDWNAVGISGMQ